jgi:hypothetical protein
MVYINTKRMIANLLMKLMEGTANSYEEAKVHEI